MFESFKNLATAVAEAEAPSFCPICKRASVPHELNVTTYKSKNGKNAMSVLFFCNGCYQTFVCQYENGIESSSMLTFGNPSYCEPNRFVERDFSDMPDGISSDFKRIYNQALAAESAGLDEIAGMGYRKSLEFLIKDFLIGEYPDEAESIKRMHLGQCISSKIQDDNLKAVALRCAWVGNDEAHYYRKHSSLGIDDLKKLLHAALYWVSTILYTKEAMEIQAM